MGEKLQSLKFFIKYLIKILKLLIMFQFRRILARVPFLLSLSDKL
jgi:hypothetical protein